VSIELRVLCEGPTEQGFVTQVLAPHLRAFNVFPRSEALARGRFGIVSFKILYEAIKRDVGRSRSHQYVTTMVDLYRLPQYPGAEKQPGESALQRARRIESHMAEALPNSRFIPYVQVHEFEALVFVDVDELPSQFPDGEADGVSARLKQQIGTTPPEEINDGELTAPSKRLISEIPAYEHMKSIAGPAIAARIGLPRLRRACPHLNAWITSLEGLSNRALDERPDVAFPEP
jgi:hypothetical protein